MSAGGKGSAGRPKSVSAQQFADNWDLIFKKPTPEVVAEPAVSPPVDDIVTRLQVRASIRRQISSRKSVQEGRPDRISDLLEEAAQTILELRAAATKS